jgi:hypothetical protein
LDGVADRWAECREIEGWIAARIVEQGRMMLRPWRWRRRRELRHELSELFAALDAAIDKAEAQGPRRTRRDAFRRATAVRYEP